MESLHTHSKYNKGDKVVQASIHSYGDISLFETIITRVEACSYSAFHYETEGNDGWTQEYELYPTRKEAKEYIFDCLKDKIDKLLNQMAIVGNL